MLAVCTHLHTGKLDPGTGLAEEYADTTCVMGFGCRCVHEHSHCCAADAAVTCRLPRRLLCLDHRTRYGTHMSFSTFSKSSSAEA